MVGHRVELRGGGRPIKVRPSAVLGVGGNHMCLPVLNCGACLCVGERRRRPDCKSLNHRADRDTNRRSCSDSPSPLVGVSLPLFLPSSLPQQHFFSSPSCACPRVIVLQESVENYGSKTHSLWVTNVVSPCLSPPKSKPYPLLLPTCRPPVFSPSSSPTPMGVGTWKRGSQLYNGRVIAAEIRGLGRNELVKAEGWVDSVISEK